MAHTIPLHIPSQYDPLHPMLTALSIRDLAVADRVDLTFAPGFTAITGETGAGKSILIDALGLASGGRADSGAVRSGAEKLEVSAELQLPSGHPALVWLASQDLDDDGALLLRRIVKADGGSRAYINGRGATQQQLRDLTTLLIEIHGQHEHQALLQRAHQLDLLDEFAQASGERQAVAAAADAVRALDAEIDRLRHSDGAELVEFMTHQLRELRAGSLDPVHIANLEHQHRVLASAGELIQGLGQAEAQLGGDDDVTAVALVRRAVHDLQRLAAIDPALSALVSQLETAAIALQDATHELRDRRDALDIDPEKLAEVDAELARLHALARKHRTPIQDLAAFAADLERRVQNAATAGERLEQLLRDRDGAIQTYRRAARVLGEKRRAAAIDLANSISALMAELGMRGGRFECAFEIADGAPRGSGDEQVEFLVSANPGQPPRPLRKVASGGELARISLAIKVATIALDDTPVLVFDEVDSGIGGAIAEIVGRKLRALGAQRQVLCVTHLAQVAACAHQHFRVSKRVQGDTTQSQVDELDENERIAELARMQGGVEVTDATRAAARELLRNGARR